MEDTDGALRWIQRQYFQAVAMKYFDWEKLKTTTIEQESLLKATYLHPLRQKYSPSNAYNLTFLKKLLSIYEDNGWEICEEIYHCITDIITCKINQDTFKYKSYILPCGEAITLCESTQLISQGTTGLNSWQAGLFLSNWLMQKKDVFQGKNVLELGCGIGLAGIVGLHCCRPKAYIFTDCHEKVLEKLQENLKINGFVQSFEEKYSAGKSEKERELHKDIQRSESNCFSVVNTNSINPEKDVKDDSSSPDIMHCVNAETLGREIIDMRPGIFEKYSSNENFRIFHSPNSLQNCETCRFLGKCPDEKHTSRAIVGRLDWQTFTLAEAKCYSPDIIVAADVVFDPSLFDSLVNVIKIFLSLGKERKAFIASTVRNRETYEQFLVSLDKCGIKKSWISDVPEKLFLYESISEIKLLRLEL